VLKGLLSDARPESRKLLDEIHDLAGELPDRTLDNMEEIERIEKIRMTCSKMLSTVRAEGSLNASLRPAMIFDSPPTVAEHAELFRRLSSAATDQTTTSQSIANLLHR